MNLVVSMLTSFLIASASALGQVQSSVSNDQSTQPKEESSSKKSRPYWGITEVQIGLSQMDLAGMKYNGEPVYEKFYGQAPASLAASFGSGWALSYFHVGAHLYGSFFVDTGYAMSDVSNFKVDTNAKTEFTVVPYGMLVKARMPLLPSKAVYLGVGAALERIWYQEVRTDSATEGQTEESSAAATKRDVSDGIKQAIVTHAELGFRMSGYGLDGAGLSGDALQIRSVYLTLFADIRKQQSVVENAPDFSGQSMGFAFAFEMQ
jgi:hypothetical protein